jgi:soluble lytic murein transglycosylase
VQARLVLAQGRPWQPVLSRWPRDPASWDLQWDLARRALLQRQWPLASRILASLDSRLLPAPLAASLMAVARPMPRLAPVTI